MLLNNDLSAVRAIYSSTIQKDLVYIFLLTYLRYCESLYPDVVIQEALEQTIIQDKAFIRQG